MADYELAQVTTETWQATCGKCGRSFRSDVRAKAEKKVKDHLRGKHKVK